MSFGSASPDLLTGARNAVDVCLAIHPGERVALIADEASSDVAASLEQALAEREARAQCLLIESVSPRPMPEAPRAVLDALEQADAGILCVQPQEGELAARMAIVAVVERRRIRYAHMVGVTPRIMREGMRADYRQVDRLSQQLCDRMQHRANAYGADEGGHQLFGPLRSHPGVGEDERDHQPAVLVQPSCRRSVHDAGER